MQAASNLEPEQFHFSRHTPPPTLTECTGSLSWRQSHNSTCSS